MCIRDRDDNIQLAQGSVLDADLPLLPDQDTPALIKPQTTATAAISSATSTHATTAARKSRQSEFDVQCGKSMECLQDLIKTLLDKKTDEEDDIVGTDEHFKISNKLHCDNTSKQSWVRARIQSNEYCLLFNAL